MLRETLDRIKELEGFLIENKEEILSWTGVVYANINFLSAPPGRKLGEGVPAILLFVNDEWDERRKFFIMDEVPFITMRTTDTPQNLWWKRSPGEIRQGD